MERTRKETTNRALFFHKIMAKGLTERPMGPNPTSITQDVSLIHLGSLESPTAINAATLHAANYVKKVVTRPDPSLS